MNDNRPTMIIRRNRAAGVWTATFRCPQSGNLITAPTPFSVDALVGTVVAHIRQASPRVRVGFPAAYAGPATKLACLQAGHVVDGEPIVWMKAAQEA
jgi:hypothetical protein